MNTPSETFETSREAYEYCIANGILSQRVAEVLKAICDGGPMNQTMAHQAIIRATGQVGLEKYSVSPRFSVLERMGLIRQICKQPCPVTGRTTVFFVSTDCRPKMTEADALKPTKTRETEAALRKENAELKEDVAKLRELLNMRSAAYQHKERQIQRQPVAIQTSMFDT